MSAPEQSSTLPPPSAIVLLVTSDDSLVSRVRAMTAPDRSITVHASTSIGDAEIEALELAGGMKLGESDDLLGDEKGDEIETVILSIDPERERISLGIKQLEEDSFTIYLGESDKGSIVNGEVTEVDAKSVTIKLADEVEGILKASDISREKVEDARSMFKVGDSVEAKIISVDRKTRGLMLSIKAKDFDDEKEAVQSLKETEQEKASPGTIGDLIKAQMDDQ